MSWTIIIYAIVFFWICRIVGRWLWSLNTLHAANQDRKSRAISLEMQRLQLEEQKKALEAQTLALKQQQMQIEQRSPAAPQQSNQAERL